jgi:capsular polysaccharide export protein
VPESALKPATWKTVATFSRKLAGVPHLAELLGAERVVYLPLRGRGIDAVVGWKAWTRAGVAFAAAHRLPYVRLEDGFLRSVGLGVEGDPPLSIVVDDAGIYYDARSESRLERLIAEGRGDTARARRAIDRIVAARLSKYNGAPPGPVDLGPARRRVLVVDQTRGDRSVSCGLAGEESFRAMLETAIAENPSAEVVVKTHPDVSAGKRRGYLLRVPKGVRLFREPVNPLALLEPMERVYVVSSQLGFEALLLGKHVTCFGAPFNAGWGLTDDRVQVPRRGPARSLEQVFASAYLDYPRYLDPDTGRRCELERVLEHLELQREMFERNRGRMFCFGFRVWKRNYVRAYLRSPGNRIVFTESAARAERLGFDRGSRLVVWGQRAGGEVETLAERHGVPIERMEDGFIRSGRPRWCSTARGSTTIPRGRATSRRCWPASSWRPASGSGRRRSGSASSSAGCPSTTWGPRPP